MSTGGTADHTAHARRTALLAALALNLAVSVPLWWVAGGVGMTTREFNRWMSMVVVTFLVVVGFGATLRARPETAASGAGLLSGAAVAALVDAVWLSLLVNYVTD
jgi:FtsH-binding integral membrane protein